MLIDSAKINPTRHSSPVHETHAKERTPIYGTPDDGWLVVVVVHSLAISSTAVGMQKWGIEIRTMLFVDYKSKVETAKQVVNVDWV